MVLEEPISLFAVRRWCLLIFQPTRGLSRSSKKQSTSGEFGFSPGRGEDEMERKLSGVRFPKTGLEGTFA